MKRANHIIVMMDHHRGIPSHFWEGVYRSEMQEEIKALTGMPGSGSLKDVLSKWGYQKVEEDDGSHEINTRVEFLSNMRSHPKITERKYYKN